MDLEPQGPFHRFPMGAKVPFLGRDRVDALHPSIFFSVDTRTLAHRLPYCGELGHLSP